MAHKEKIVAPKLGLGASIRKGMASEKLDVDGRLSATTGEKSPNLNGSDGLAAHTSATGSPADISKVPRLHVALEELVSNPFNPREFYNSSDIDELAVLLRREGQHVPIVVTKNARFPGKYVIVDGERRFRAKKSLGETTIDCELVEELTDQDLYIRASSINRNRAEQTVFDDAVAWERVLAQSVFESQDALAESLGVTKSTVSKTLHIAKLPKAFLERMAAKEGVGLAHAYNIKLIVDKAGNAAAERILELVLAGEMSVRRLEEHVKKLDSTSPPRTAKKTHYSGNVPFQAPDGREIGALKQYRDGRTELKLSGLSEQQQALIVAKLEMVVREFVASEFSIACDTQH
ncbi:ParB/RepB/Spo0J family partition protein [Caballeronia sp. LZ032]|uniref:ParB/RepB/Spo0J family partition protein n=1 Tax=Caballeronia sp. LZ032 TaxID=3038565 RepID=UPI0028574067|nr:ParB/RepB/Spo0J family partition protein [Caballeronia sp. LZ032]MDR5884099.1 ParB/RepB/Spo0J family partition protein [Caballeronia sp. LZ032]